MEYRAVCTLMILALAAAGCVHTEQPSAETNDVAIGNDGDWCGTNTLIRARDPAPEAVVAVLETYLDISRTSVTILRHPDTTPQGRKKAKEDLELIRENLPILEALLDSALAEFEDGTNGQGK
jgi:hypothetical protein